MKTAWHRFLGPLTPGARGVLLVLTVACVTALIGIFSRTYNLYEWLALSGTDFWKGHVWTIITYALLPASIWDFLFNWIMILFLGIWLERNWSRRELWICCLLATLTVGLVKVIVQPSGTRLMVGTMPIVFALLAAWGQLFTYEKVLMWFIWEMTVREAAILVTIIGFVIMLPCAGLANASIMLCGTPAGLFYVWANTKIANRRGSRTVSSERMGRLEL